MAKNVGGFNSVRRQDKVRTLIIASLLMCVLLGSVGAMFILGPGSDDSKQVEVVREQKLDTIDVLVPAKQIEAGTFLEPSLFRVESRPKVGLSPRAVTGFDQVRGTYARTLIASDQPLVSDYLTKVKPNSAITANIPDGFRAVTIRVDARSSVEGWARPGARVDVVWASMVRGEQAVTTIVQNAKVLSAERQIEGNQNPQPGTGEGGVPNTVTLLVSVDDAAKIQLASTAGTMSLSLRNDKDVTGPRSANSLTLRDLLNQTDDTNTKSIKKQDIIRIRRPDGGYDEMAFDDGRLVPLTKN